MAPRPEPDLGASAWHPYGAVAVDSFINHGGDFLFSLPRPNSRAADQFGRRRLDRFRWGWRFLAPIASPEAG